MPERPVNNLPPGSQPWAREIAGAIDAAQFDAIKANMNNKNAFKTINATLEQLANQINAMPVVVNSGISNTSFDATGSGWITVLSLTIPTPDGMTRGQFTVNGNAGVLDALSGGVTSVIGRILINGVASPEFFPAKDAGASAVLNVLSMNWYRPLGAVSANTTFTLQIDPLNDSAFPSSPSNYAVLTATGTFYRA